MLTQHYSFIVAYEFTTSLTMRNDMMSFKARDSSYTPPPRCKMKFSSTDENGRKRRLICKKYTKMHNSNINRNTDLEDDFVFSKLWKLH